MNTANKVVQVQYEELPYPFRNPEDEKKEIQVTFGDCLDFVNHVCYGGEKDFAKEYSVLIAGGGTGDSVVLWAENLRDNPKAKIVYLDFSSASRAIAEERLRIRGLHDRVTFYTDSILNIPNLNLGKFDFINCCGVLHHLENPNEGLAALNSALKDDGVMNIMLYGKYGRFGVYPVQELMRIINEGETDTEEKIANTLTVLKSLPKNNFFVNNFNSMQITNKIEAYDLFLHSRDKPYAIRDIYEFANSSKLHIAEFFSGLNAGARSDFSPERYAATQNIKDIFTKLEPKEKHEVAEVLNSRMAKHCFYLTKKTVSPTAYGLDMIPSYSVMTDLDVYEKIAELIRVSKDVIEMQLGAGTMRFRKTKNLELIFKYIDGKSSFRDIFKKVMAKSEGENLQTLMAELKPTYELFNNVYMMNLRKSGLPAYKMIRMMQRHVTELYK